MHEHIDKLKIKRHDNDSLSWRNFIREKVLRQHPTLDSSIVDAYECYGYLLNPSQERLGRPASDSFKLKKDKYEVQALLYGTRPSTDNQKLSESDIAACKDFIDSTSQFFGDEYVFSSIKNIVFTPPASGHKSAGSKFSRGINWKGAVASAAPGVIFINSKQSLDYESLVNVLHHEFAHIRHGVDISDSSEVLESVGWRATEMDEVYPDWRTRLHPVSDAYFKGDESLFSSLAQENPRETIAELYTEFMESDNTFKYGEVARDALINYLSKDSKEVLATSLDWQPVGVKSRRY